MSHSLISSLTATLGAETFDSIAADGGAAKENVAHAFRASIAAILGGIVEAMDNPDGTRQVFALIKATDSGLPSSEAGQRLLSTIFGQNKSAVIQGISHQCDLPSNIVVQILSLAAPKVLSFIRSRVEDQQVSLSGLPNLLFREAGDISSYLPASVHNLLRTPKPTLEDLPAWIVLEPKAAYSRGGQLAICLMIAAVLAIAWLVWRSHGDVTTVERLQDVNRARERFSGLGRFMERELPGGMRIDVPENGMESKLLSYIQDPVRSAGKELWFDFDRVTFETNSAIPKPDSEEQLTNLASILKAYPHVRLKVGGYTDNTGNRRANQRLSENRAESVVRELIGLGIASNRAEAEGFGDQHAIADNATEQGRAKNRRISVKVLQK
jgi:outer membrane protein OmpA-like peptidoglycan-associated protein